MTQNARVARIAFALQWLGACAVLAARQHLAFGTGVTGPAKTTTTLVGPFTIAASLMAVRTANSYIKIN